MRIAYPLLWSGLSRKASWEQAAETLAALARAGHEVTALMARERYDPALTAADVRDYFGVEGDFELVQRPSRWAGESLAPSLMWLRELFADPIVREADLLYSRIPAMLGMGGLCPVPFATDHYRPWPDDLPVIRPLVRRTARNNKCLGLILHSSFAADAYLRAGVPADRMLIAHNGAPSGLSTAPVGKAAARLRLDLPSDRPIALYAGRINAEKGLDQVLATAALRPDILFLLVGSEGEGTIERAAAAHSNVRVLPWAAPDRLPLWLAAADILLIPWSRAPLEQFGNCVLPLKLFAYLAAGRPILAPVAPDTAELLHDGDTALLVPPGEPEAAARALDRLLHETGLADRLANHARRLSQELTWDARAARITDFLERRLADVRG